MHKAVLILVLSPLVTGALQAQKVVTADKRTWLQELTGSRSYLGVGVAEVDSQRVKELNLKEERGVEIRRVEPGSPAEKAGLREKDVVLEYNGQRVEGTEQFTRMVRETPPGRTARIAVNRGGSTQTVTATIGEREGADFVGKFPIPPIPPLPPVDVPRPLVSVRTTRIGVETESLTDQLADFFGVKEGVLVRAVERDSPAAKAGLRAGDVIVRVDGRAVRGAREISQHLRDSWEKKTVPVQVVREKKEMTLQLELPERQRGEQRPSTRPAMLPGVRL